jgi:hypothetical protein
VEVQEVRWDRGDTKPEAKYIFFYGREWESYIMDRFSYA